MDPDEFITMVTRLRELGVARFKYDVFEVDFRPEAWQPLPARENFLSVEQIDDIRNRESKDAFEKLAYHSS